MSQSVCYGCRLEPAVKHAVGTLGMAARTVAIPIGLFHERLEIRGIALRQKIARPLPTQDITRGIRPGSALVGPVASQKIKK